MPIGRLRLRKTLESMGWNGECITPSKNHKGHKERELNHMLRVHKMTGPRNRCDCPACELHREMVTVGLEHRPHACRCPLCSLKRQEKRDAAERQRQKKQEIRLEKKRKKRKHRKKPATPADARREYHRQYRKDNREHIRELSKVNSKKYYAKFREKIIKRNRAYVLRKRAEKEN